MVPDHPLFGLLGAILKDAPPAMQDEYKAEVLKELWVLRKFLRWTSPRARAIEEKAAVEREVRTGEKLRLSDPVEHLQLMLSSRQMSYDDVMSQISAASQAGQGATVFPGQLSAIDAGKARKRLIEFNLGLKYWEQVVEEDPGIMETRDWPMPMEFSSWAVTSPEARARWYWETYNAQLPHLRNRFREASMRFGVFAGREFMQKLSEMQKDPRDAQ